VNLWYGGKKKLKSLAVGQVWRPEPEAAGLPALTDDDAGTDTGRAISANAANAVANANKREKAKAGAKSSSGSARAKPQVRRRNSPDNSGSSR
jgi:preprotein translocase subunit SecD